MKRLEDFHYPREKKPLAILLLSSAAILGASALSYGQSTYQTSLSVSGSSTGTGSSPSLSISPMMMLLPIALAAVITIAMFTTLRRASNRPPKIPRVKTSLTPPPATESAPPISPPESSEQETSSETVVTPPEEATVEPPSNSGLDSIDRILQSLREKDEEDRESSGGDSAGSSQ